MLEDFTKEITERVPYLQSPHLAYLFKGLRYLNHSDINLSRALESRFIQISDTLSPYTISKALYYFQQIERGLPSVLNAACTSLLAHIQKGNLHTLQTKDFKDIVVSLSHIIFEPDHFQNRSLPSNEIKIESSIQALATQVMREISPYICAKIREDSALDNPRAAKFQTLSNIAYSYSKARLFDQSAIFEAMSDEIVWQVQLRERFNFLNAS